ncbi:MAG: glycosyltransferase family 4 protein [Microcoleaceae cyanobacterium MO_207.B10]|nr:glycosyltransferase family 4 protein [Microcoleaceae cyanobacterium MO_207.B10]
MVKRLALLTNFIPPYRLPLYQAIAQRVSEFKVFISTPMEANRSWQTNWEGLNVTVQKNLTFQRTWRHPEGFSEPIYLHIPYDTLWLLHQYQPDVIISGELGMRSLQAALYRKFHPKTRLIIWATLSEYSEKGRGWLRHQLRRVLLPQADAVLVNGNSGKRYISNFGISEEKIFFAPYTTNISPFVAIPLSRESDRAYRLLSVGQLVERKGLLQFMNILVKWGKNHPEQNLEFWIAGSGLLKETLVAQPLPENLKVKFLGNIEYQKLPEIYAQAGIFIFPTLADEWGVVTNEAMAAGLPVLGSLYSQSVEELVKDYITGWLFRPDNQDEMYSTLEKALATTEEDLAKMRSKARDRIQYLTPDFVADNILEAISSVTQK